MDIAIPTQIVCMSGLMYCIVSDGHAGVDRAARRVDVDRDVLVGILGLQMDELRHDQVGDLIVHGSPEEDDSLVQKPRVDVEGALAFDVCSTTIGINGLMCLPRFLASISSSR